MSLNNLPDELIAQMGSHLPFEDIVRLLQTQKRIQRILVRNKLDRPNAEELRLGFAPLTGHVCFRARINEKSQIVTVYEGKPQQRVDQELLKVLSKFSTISKLHFMCLDPIELDLNYANSFVATDTKIRSAKFSNNKITLEPSMFVRFCKLFDEISFISTEISPDVLTDDMFCQIVANTTMNILKSPCDQLKLTDRTLEAMMKGKIPSRFLLNFTETMFTARGIGRFIEHVCGQNMYFHGHFGCLRTEEQAEARRWAAEVNQQQKMPFFVNNTFINSFEIWIKQPRVPIAEFRIEGN